MLISRKISRFPNDFWSSTNSRRIPESADPILKNLHIVISVTGSKPFSLSKVAVEQVPIRRGS
jgi:hypothetical protein